MPEHHDVFISNSPVDEEWVDDWLVPKLVSAGISVVTEQNLVVGAFQVSDRERIIADSRHVIVVLTPEYLQSQWDTFESILAQTMDIDARRRKLLPVLLRPCDPPVALRARVGASMILERRRERELKRLVNAIIDTKSVSPPWVDGKGRDWGAWRRWLRRYRRQVRWGAVGAMFFVLVLALALQVFPFQPRLAWIQMAGPFPDAWVLHNTGTTLVVGGRNETTGCNLREQGIWYQATDGRFSASDIAISLCVENWKPKGMSAVVAFASDPARPRIVYALTSHSGVLMSHDSGAHFDRAAPAPPPSAEAQGVSQFGVQSGTQDTFWASGRDNGLWRYGLDVWTRLDGGGPGACTDLPLVRVRSLLVHGERVLIGTDQQGLWLTEDGGITCRSVFDAESPSQYEFLGLAALAPMPSDHYLVLAWDNMSADASPGQLFELCARPGICTPERWQADPPLWEGGASVEQLLLQPDSNTERWYLLAAAPFVRVWFGELSVVGHRHTLTVLPRCFGQKCWARLVSAGPGEPPYLLAAGRIYRYGVGAWWRRVWP